MIFFFKRIEKKVRPVGRQSRRLITAHFLVGNHRLGLHTERKVAAPKQKLLALHNWNFRFRPQQQAPAKTDFVYFK